MEFIKKNKKYIILCGIGLLFILVGLLSWKLYFSKLEEFKREEKLFIDTVKSYYEVNKSQLPLNGEIKEITLQSLYDKGKIEPLTQPGTVKPCDNEASWVKIYNDNGNYKYTAYLKCGSFKSNVDHTGPVITLNGEDTITLLLNEEYKEAGVSLVKDNKDGKIDVNKVVIDSSKVDTTKVGTYKVSYTVSDKVNNKTTIYRNVIVRKSLSKTVIDSTDESNYYKGIGVNNYLLFSGMLYRIINVNNDGTVKIIADDNIASLAYGNNEYSDSPLRYWLNNYYYKNLTNPDKYLVDYDFCYSDGKCVKDKVGMLTLSDYNNSIYGNGSYLSTKNEYRLLSLSSNDGSYALGYITGGLGEIDYNVLTGIRPIIVLKDGLYITSGFGTFDNPYTIGDYSSGKKGSLLKDRLIGEYLVYSGMTFRISEFDDKDIKVISTDYLINQTTGENIYSGYENTNMLFDSSEEGNLGYSLNDKYIDYIDSSLIVSKKYNTYKYDIDKKYSDYEIIKTYNSKLSIPSSFEMFSNNDGNSLLMTRYWLRDYVSDTESFMINSDNGRVFTVNDSFFRNNGFKLVFYLKNNIKIKSGNGTINNPYIIQ